MTAAVLPAATNGLANKSLISAQLWNRLVSRIMREHDVERSYAERIMDQALAFLRLCAMCPGQPFAPSRTVDIGWHTFILYTQEYVAFCEAIAGRFIHHAPNDEGEAGDDDTNYIADTVAALISHGIDVDEELWAVAGDRKGHPCEMHECRSLH